MTTERQSKQTSISVNKVKDILDSMVNQETDRCISDLNGKLKTFNTYQWQLKNKRVTEFDSNGEPLRKEVPDVDKETGLQKVESRVHPDDIKKKRSQQRKVEVLKTKEIVVGHEITPEEEKERNEYIIKFTPMKERIQKKVAAYRTHKVKFTDDALKAFNNSLSNLSVDYIIKAANYARLVNLKNKKAPKKNKINMLHMVACNPWELSGIKLFLNPVFFDALKSHHEQENRLAKEEGRKEMKAELKKNYVKSDSVKNVERVERLQREMEEEKSELEKYKGLSYEEVLSLKKKEKESSSSLKKEKKELKQKEKNNFCFANAIKTQYKSSAEYQENPCALSMEVLRYLENLCHSVLNNLVSNAVTSCLANETGTFDEFDALLFMSSFVGDSFGVSRKLELTEVESFSKKAYEDELEKQRKLKDEGKPYQTVDKSKLPLEEDFEVSAESQYSGAFGKFFESELSPVLEARKAARELAKKRREEKSKKSDDKEDKTEKKVEKEDKTEKRESKIIDEDEPQIVRRRR